MATWKLVHFQIRLYLFGRHLTIGKDDNDEIYRKSTLRKNIFWSRILDFYYHYVISLFFQRKMLILMTLHISELGGQIYCPPSSRAHCFVSWADNRFVHVSFSGNPQNICDKPIVSDIQSHENNVCDRFVSLEQNSSQLSWETMTYFQPSPLRGSGWKCHCFSLKLRWILFSRDETVANVLFTKHSTPIYQPTTTISGQNAAKDNDRYSIHLRWSVWLLSAQFPPELYEEVDCSYHTLNS